MKLRRSGGWLGLCTLCALCACGGSGGDPEPAACEPSCAGSAAGSGGAAGGTAGSAGQQPDASAEPMAGSAPPQPSRPLPNSCRPTGPAADALGSARTVLYTGPRALSSVAVRRERLFVVDSADGLLRLTLGGASAALERVVQAQVDAFLAADLNLYWSTAGALYRVSGGDTDAEPDPVGMQLGAKLSALTYDTDHLYFADAAQKTLSRIAIMGGSPERLASNVEVLDQIVRAGDVYFADASAKRVQAVAVAGGAVAPVSPAALSKPLALDADTANVYWADGFEIVATAREQATSRKSLGLSGPDSNDLPADIVRLELVGERVYWTDAAGNLGWTATSGASCGLVVRGAGDVRGSDVDDDGEAAYLSVATTAGSELWRIAL